MIDERTAGGSPAPGADAATPAALRHLAAAVGVFAACALVPYAVPGADRLRLWLPGDPVPLAALIEELGTRELPTFAGAGAGGAYRSPAGAEAGAAPRGGPGAGAAGAAGAPDDGPRGGDAPPGVRIDPDEHAGIEVELERPEALAHFYRALERTAADTPGAITRVAHYGDSSIATDLITHTVRRRFQQRFGDAGHGFVLISSGGMPYAHRDVKHRSDGDWELRQLVMGQDRDGLYGYGGVQFRARGGAAAMFGTDDRGPVGGRVSRFELFFLRHPNGGDVRLTVDDEEPVVVSTEGPDGDGFHRIEVPDGPHELVVRPVGGGQARLFGVVLERAGPGVVYDSLGLVGARARRLLNYDRDHIASQIAHRDPDLVVLGFGGNSADDPVLQPDRYEEEMVRVIRRMRGPRSARSCLLFGPLDQAQRNERGAVTTFPNIPVIVAAQRRAAEREGCAFFDAFAAMGGEGAMRRWTRARPALAVPDYRHLTPEGYERIGELFYKALLRGFARHVGAR